MRFLWHFFYELLIWWNPYLINCTIWVIIFVNIISRNENIIKNFKRVNIMSLLVYDSTLCHYWYIIRHFVSIGIWFNVNKTFHSIRSRIIFYKTIFPPLRKEKLILEKWYEFYWTLEKQHEISNILQAIRVKDD